LTIAGGRVGVRHQHRDGDSQRAEAGRPEAERDDQGEQVPVPDQPVEGGAEAQRGRDQDG